MEDIFFSILMLMAGLIMLMLHNISNEIKKLIKIINFLGSKIDSNLSED